MGRPCIRVRGKSPNVVSFQRTCTYIFFSLGWLGKRDFLNESVLRLIVKFLRPELLLCEFLSFFVYPKVMDLPASFKTNW
jgi:hypothetical protein